VPPTPSTSPAANSVTSSICFDRGDGALDRHLRDVHDEATAIEAVESVAQRDRPLQVGALPDYARPLRIAAVAALTA